MTWKDRILGLGRRLKARNATQHPADELTASLFEDDILPSLDPSEDYYVLVHERRYPALTWDDAQSHPLFPDDFDQPESAQPAPDQVEAVLRLRLSTPGQGMGLADFHRANMPVVSQAVRDILQPLALPGLEFFPALIRVTDGPAAEAARHYALHLDLEVDCLDENRCEYLPADSEDEQPQVVRMALDSDRLARFEPRQRLLFKPLGSHEYLFHRQLVRLLEAHNLRGARWVPLLEWRLGLETG